MLIKLIVRNFKRFENAEIELGNPVVFIGPNNSGKTSALQALALWDVGLKRWTEKRKTKTASKRPGVTVNRRDLIAIPVPNANLLWCDLHVRDVSRGPEGQKTKNIRIDIVVEGITEDVAWSCGFEFDYANEESFYCRPLRLPEGEDLGRMQIPDKTEYIRIAYLPPMSGLAATEDRLDPGSINVRIGEGRTAEVLRNLCYKISGDEGNQWRNLIEHIKRLFGVELDMPEYIAERGEIVMTYKEHGTRLDLSSSGRGLQQTLLLLSYMYANPGAILLLDEPDAHLEILRQRQIYQLLTDVAETTGSQIIAASHSEVLLNEAADRDVVVAFLGNPHRINDRGSQVLKSLKEIGYEQYFQAEQTGWVLYLEGSTDLAILQTFAKLLGFTEAVEVLDRPFIHYVGNQPRDVAKHFWGLREAVPNLQGIAIFDRLNEPLPDNPGAQLLMWKRREIENYLCYRETLEAYARAFSEQETPGPLFASSEVEKRLKSMYESIEEVSQAMETLGVGSPWDQNTKVSDNFLDSLFKTYFRKLGLYNIMAKKNYHELANYVPKNKLDPEIKEKLRAIVQTAKKAGSAKDQIMYERGQVLFFAASKKG